MSLNKQTFPTNYGLVERCLVSAGFMLVQTMSAAWSAQDVVACPLTLSAQAIQIDAPTPEWTSFVNHSLSLTSVSLMQGAPVTQAHLKPNRTTSTKKGSTVIWMFEGEFPEGKWLSCSYGDGAITLSKKIAETYSECSVSYQGSGGNRIVSAIVCKE